MYLHHHFSSVKNSVDSLEVSDNSTPRQPRTLAHDLSFEKYILDNYSYGRSYHQDGVNFPKSSISKQKELKTKPSTSKVS